MNTKHVILTQHYPSPCGDLILGSYEDRLCLCNWVIEKHQGRVDKRLQNLLNADYKEGKSDIIQEAAVSGAVVRDGRPAHAAVTQ